MYRFIIATLALTLLLCFSAMATDTRVMTMGDNNNILLDDANISLYPGRVIEYPNLAIGEFDGDGFTNFGVTWKFGDDNPWVLGTFFSNMDAYDPGIPGLDPLPNRRIDLFYGRTLGGNNFGLHFGLLHSSEEAEGVLNPYNQSFTHFALTAGLTEANGQWDLAARVGFGDWTNENDGVALNEKDAWNEFGVAARYFKQNGPNYTFIPHAGIGIEKVGIKNNDGTGTLVNTETAKFTFFDLGAGLNYTPSNAVLAVLDFGIMYGKLTNEDEPAGGSATEETLTMTTLPYFKLGLDADVFKWLDIRMGATSYWNNDKFEVGTSKTTSKYASNETYLGFGFHWGNLHIDTYTDPGMFLDGFNFLSGADNDMNFRFSAVYEM